MPTTRMAVGFYAVAGAESEAFPMSWACGMAGSSNEIPTKLVRTAVRKGQFGAKKGPFGSTKFRPVMPW